MLAALGAFEAGVVGAEEDDLEARAVSRYARSIGWMVFTRILSRAYSGGGMMDGSTFKAWSVL